MVIGALAVALVILYAPLREYKDSNRRDAKLLAAMKSLFLPIQRKNSMKCPSCPDTTLLMTDRQGVEVDYCPACRGIWLDRGELDKLLDRAATVAAPAATMSAPAARNHSQPDFEDSDFRSGQRYQRERKKSWLSEIFD